MKIPAYFLLLLLSLAAAPALATEPTDAELNDWMNYLRSVGIASTVKICGEALQDVPRFTSAAEAWSTANRESVERGHSLASANPPKGWKTLEDYNEALIKDYEAKLSSKTQSERVAVCTKYLQTLEKSGTK